MNKLILSHANVINLVDELADTIDSYENLKNRTLRAYPIPRGGVPVLYLLSKEMECIRIVNDPKDADFFVDDLIDSGSTRRRMHEQYPDKPFFTLINKRTNEQYKDKWIVFPWEQGQEGDPEENIVRMLQYIGEDPRREGLLETPKRVIKAWKFWTKGYTEDPATILKTFVDGSEGVEEMVVVRDIPFYSACVVGSTFVETPRGRVPIKRLKDGDLIYTMDPNTFELAIVPCIKPGITKRNANLVQIHTDNDSLICTPEHKILKTDGTWVEAKDLRNNDRLASLYRGFSAIAEGLQVTKAYPKLVASRYTRWDRGLVLADQPNGIVEHRFVKNFFEPHCYPIDRKLVTHHIDETTWNNLPCNLEVITQSEHNKRHGLLGYKMADNKKRKEAVAKSSSREEVRAKRSASVKAYWDRIKQDKEAYSRRCEETSIGIWEKRNHVVFGIEHLEYTEDVYCMTVPDTHLFFANGIAVHNCEHHMATFFGTATVAYLPDKRIVGLSKINRLVEAFARRLQVQERLTCNIADALMEHLTPLGCGVVVKARHMCVESRGVQHRQCVTLTSALRGIFKTDAIVRSEFLELAKDGREP